MDANVVSSSSGSRRMEAARSSPQPQASRPPLSSSPDPPPRRTSAPCSSAIDPPPPRTSTPSSSALDAPPPSRTPTPSSSGPASPYHLAATPLAEPSASASREGNNHRDLVIDVQLMTKDSGMDSEVVTFQSSQTVQDIIEYFEKERGKDKCPAESMVVYYDGTKLSGATILDTLDLKTWNVILLNYKEDVSRSTSNLARVQEGMADEGQFSRERTSSVPPSPRSRVRPPRHRGPSGIGALMDANVVSSLSGFRRMEAARSSPPPHASRPPLSSSPDPPPRRTSTPCSSAIDLPPPRTSTPSSAALNAPPPSRTPMSSSSTPASPSHLTPTPLAEPSASSSCEGSNHQDRVIHVHLIIEDVDLDTVVFRFQPSHTVQDILEYFEEERGNILCPVEDVVVLYDGTEISNTTILETLNLESWNYILLTYAGHVSQPTSNLAPTQDAMVDQETSLAYEFGASPASQEAAEHMVNHFHFTIDYPSALVQSAVAEISIAESTLASTAEIADTPAEIALHTAESAIPTAETSSAAAETSLNLGTPSCSHVLVGRLLIPVTPANISDQLLSANHLHGFKSVHDLINAINSGPPRWNTKKQCLGLLYNAHMFSISDFDEDSKMDGLSCVVDSTKCQISITLGGYSVVGNGQSSENLIGKMKEKGVEMDWFEVRGKFWSRRRLVLRGGDGVFHLLQWKQHQNTETTDAAARASTSSEHTSQELPHRISNAATRATAPDERTHGLREEISGGARGGGIDEMRALMQNFQTTMCSQIKEFQTSVCTQLSQFSSEIQRIDTRVQVMEEQQQQQSNFTTPTIGSTPERRESGSNTHPLPPSDEQ